MQAEDACSNECELTSFKFKTGTAKSVNNCEVAEFSGVRPCYRSITHVWFDHPEIEELSLCTFA